MNLAVHRVSIYMYLIYYYLSIRLFILPYYKTLNIFVDTKVKRDSAYICSHHLDHMPKYRQTQKVSVDVSVPPCGGKVAVFSEFPPVNVEQSIPIISFVTKCNHSLDSPSKSETQDNVITIGYNGNTETASCQWCGKQISNKEAKEKKARLDCMMAAKARCEIDNNRHELSKIISYRDFDVKLREVERADARIESEKEIAEQFNMQEIEIQSPKYKTTYNYKDKTLEKEDLELINDYKHTTKWESNIEIKKYWRAIEKKDIHAMNAYFNENSLLKKEDKPNKKIRELKIENEKNILNELTNIRLDDIIQIMSDNYMSLDLKNQSKTDFEKMNPDKQIVTTKKNILNKLIIQDVDPEMAIENLRHIHQEKIRRVSELEKEKIDRITNDDKRDNVSKESDEFIELPAITTNRWRQIIMVKLMKDIRKDIISRRLFNRAKDTRHRKWVNLQKYINLRKSENEEKGCLSALALYLGFGKTQQLKSGLKNSKGHTSGSIHWLKGDISKTEEYERSDEEDVHEVEKMTRKSKIMKRRPTGYSGLSSNIINDLNQQSGTNNSCNTVWETNNEYERLNTNNGGNTYNNNYDFISLDNLSMNCKHNTNNNKYIVNNNNNINNNNHNDNNDDNNNIACLTDDIGGTESDYRLYENVLDNINNNAYYQEYQRKPRMVDKSTFVRPRNTSCRCCEFGCPAESQNYGSSNASDGNYRRRSVREESVHRAGSPNLLMAQPDIQNHRMENRRKSSIQREYANQQSIYDSIPRHQQQQHIPFSQSITSGILRPERRGNSILNGYVADVESSMKIEVGTLLKSCAGIVGLWLISNVYRYGITGYFKYLLGIETEEPHDEVFMRYFENK